MNSENRILLTSFLLCFMVVTLCSFSAAFGQPGDEGTKVPKLQGILKDLSDSYTAGNQAQTTSMIESQKLTVANDMVRVMLEITPGTTLDEASLASYGVQVERKHDSFWRVMAPIGSLQRMAAELSSVNYIHTPQQFHLEATTGQGVALTGANTWQGAGYTASGVKVAVIDEYYGYLSNAIANGDIPTIASGRLHEVDYVGGGHPFDEKVSGVANWHGTTCAEMLMDMAPGCDLTLIKINDLSDITTAKDYCKTNGIKVVSMSLGYYNNGDYAGHGPICDVVNDAYNNGIFWAKSAGNNAAGLHYMGTFSDPDANGWHNFSGSDETNSLGSISSGSGIYLYLSWGWPTSNQDYDMYLYRQGVSSPVASSVNPQTGSEPPIEEIDYSVTTTGTYYVKIQKKNATVAANFQLFSEGAGTLTYNTAATSLSEPADAVGAFAVGSLMRCNWPSASSPDSYSSRGPTVDARIKPEITGPTLVDVGILSASTCTPVSGFGGTSGSAPHAAGAAALVFGAFPSYTLAQVWSYLESHATDKGTLGVDNDWGWGLLQLGALPVAEALTVTSPNGGEDWVVGSTHNITWTSSGPVGALVSIDYSINGGSSWTSIFGSTANDGTEPWVIPNTPSTNCLVRVTDADGNPTDASNAVFTISAPPALQCFDFNDGTLQGWTMAGMTDENGNSLVNPFVGLDWWDYASYPHGPNSDPVGDNKGSALFSTLGWSAHLPGGAQWAIVKVLSPDLSASATWQSASGYTVQIFQQMSSTTIYANLFVKVHDNDLGTDRYFYNGTAQPLTYSGWKQMSIDWSSMAGFPTNYVVLGTFVNIWFANDSDNEGGVWIDDICPVGGGPRCTQPMLSLLGNRTVGWADPLWTVQVEVHNAGPGTAKNVNVTMNEDLPWLTIVDPNCAYGDILQGGSSWGSDSYTFDLTNSPGGSFSVWFDVTYDDECGNHYRLRLDPEFNREMAGTNPMLVFKLGQNYPNPFNPTTTISYEIPSASQVNLNVYDVTGKLVRTLVKGRIGEGLHAVNWDGRNGSGVSVASGIYFYKMQAGSFTETKKMILMR